MDFKTKQKKAKLIKTIEDFFKTSFSHNYVLGSDIEKYLADTFMLEDARVIKEVNSTDVETSDGDFLSYDELNVKDLQHIVDHVIENIQASEEKTMERTRTNG